MSCVAISDLFVSHWLSSTIPDRQTVILSQSNSLPRKVHGFYEVVAELTDISPNSVFPRLLTKSLFHLESDRGLNILLDFPASESHAASSVWTDNTPCTGQAPGYASQKLDRYLSLFPFLESNEYFG